MAVCANCGRETPDRFPRCKICGGELHSKPAIAKDAPADKDRGMPKDSPDQHKPLPIAFRGYAREPVDSLLAQLEKSTRSLIAERDNLRKDLEKTKASLSEASVKLESHAGDEQALAAAESRAASLEEKSRGLAVELDEARAQLGQVNKRLSEIEAELATHQERQNAIANALIVAEQLREEEEARVESMRQEAAETQMLAQQVREAADHAQQEAETALREAHLRAEAIISEAESSKAALEAEMRELRTRAEAEAEGLLRDAQTHADKLAGEAQRNLKEQQHEADDFFEDARLKLGSLLRDLLDQIGTMSADHGSNESGSVETEARA